MNRKRPEGESPTEIILSPGHLMAFLDASFFSTVGSGGADLIGLREVVTKYSCSESLSDEQKSHLLNRFIALEKRLADKKEQLAELKEIAEMCKRKYKLTPDANKFIQ